MRWGLGMVAVVLLAAGTVWAAGDGAVEGRVRGPKKKAVKNAPVLVQVKAWPGGRFQMKSHETTTDAKGRFKLEDVIPGGSRYGVYVALVTPGHALTSRYEWSGQPKELPPIDLQCEPAPSTTLRFVDGDGKPVSGVQAFPSMRASDSGVRHRANPGRGTTGIATSDSKGLASMDYFLPGEWVGVSVRFPGGGWEQRQFLVPEPGRPVEIPRQAPETPDQDLKADGDVRKRYFLMGPKAGDVEPKEGYGLVLVLPGGDGSAEFRTWVREQYDYWVDAGYVFAEVVAPVWNPENENRTVWPSEKSPQKGMQFTTEELIHAVVRDVGVRVKVDPTRVIAAGWSSSGPALYRLASFEDTPIRGYFIAMSVFFRDQLDDIKNVRGRPFFILHSPTDERCKPEHAKQARKALEKHRAIVESASYEGGHGWGGESIDLGRRALYWLDAQLSGSGKRKR